MVFRVTYWIPILIILFVSTVVHIRLLVVVISNRKQPHYASFFFKMFISQSVLEILLIYACVFCQMFENDLIFGAEFVLNSGYIFPTFAYYGTIIFTVHTQVWGVVMISINRYVCVCCPLSKIAKFYERIGTPALSLINVTVPLLLMAGMLFQGAVHYYRTDTGHISLSTSMSNTKTNALQGMILTIVGSLVCSVCYFLIIRRLASAQRDRNSGLRDFRREKMLTVVGFALFIALCGLTLFYVFIFIYAANDDKVTVDFVRTYHIYAVMALTFVNPWMLILTNKNTRRRMLFQPSIASARTTVTAQTPRPI